MFHRRFLIPLALIGCTVLSGCATTRSEIKLNSPTSAQTAVPTTGKLAVIRLVKDERQFEQAPKDPSVPSLGFGGASQATAETKLRAIGRKRNGYGKAMGDVLLQDGLTVESVIRENLAAALRQAGYQVVEPSNARPGALIIDVHIKTFWGWINPGFWSITASANIATDLDIASKTGATHVAVHYQDSRQIVADGTWVEVIDKTLQAYRAEVTQKLGTLK
jgi:hypothetical protein